MVAIASLLACGAAGAGGRAGRKADRWIGRDASELLMQLRVDGRSVRIEEDDATGETRYIWETYNAAYTSKRVVAEDSRVIGMQGGTPIFETNVATQDVFHPATDRCTVTYTADSEGVVRRADYIGDACDWDIKAPRH
jgi:hypothetical protein